MSGLNQIQARKSERCVGTARSRHRPHPILRGNLLNNGILTVSRQPQVLPHHRRHPRL